MTQMGANLAPSARLGRTRTFNRVHTGRRERVLSSLASSPPGGRAIEALLCLRAARPEGD